MVPTADLHAQIDKLAAEAKTKGSSGATLEDYGSYKIQLSVRTTSGGAEVHAHWDDVMMVEEGSATLVTGGTVVDGKTGDDGETHGSKIDGGQSQKINVGDILTVKAGTPHQLLLEPGIGLRRRSRESPRTLIGRPLATGHRLPFTTHNAAANGESS